MVYEKLHEVTVLRFDDEQLLAELEIQLATDLLNAAKAGGMSHTALFGLALRTVCDALHLNELEGPLLIPQINPYKHIIETGDARLIRVLRDAKLPLCGDGLVYQPFMKDRLTKTYRYDWFETYPEHLPSIAQAILILKEDTHLLNLKRRQRFSSFCALYGKSWKGEMSDHVRQQYQEIISSEVFLEKDPSQLFISWGYSRENVCGLIIGAGLEEMMADEPLGDERIMELVANIKESEHAKSCVKYLGIMAADRYMIAFDMMLGDFKNPEKMAQKIYEFDNIFREFCPQKTKSFVGAVISRFVYNGVVKDSDLCQRIGLELHKRMGDRLFNSISAKHRHMAYLATGLQGILKAAPKRTLRKIVSSGLDL